VSVGATAGGMGLAALAAACFDGAVALQALEARAVASTRPGVGLVAGLLRRPRWLAATALAIMGWPLQVAALALAPLTLVQPTLAVGLVLLLVLGAHLLGEPVRARDVAGVVAIGGGLGVLAWAAPEANHVHAGAAVLIAVLGSLAGIAALPWALAGGLAPGLLVLGAGCGYAASGITTKLLADSLAAGTPLAVSAWVVLTAAVAGIALADEMGALQRAGAARVATGAFALQVLVPVACAPLLTGEHWGATPLGGGAIALGVALVIAGTLALSTAPNVSRLIAGSHAADP
jgi:drug/metabolite transporter (DMT)-like permease